MEVHGSRAADHVLTGFSAAGEAEIIDDGAVLIDGDRIVAVGNAEALRRGACGAEELGGRGRVAIPGLVNAHHHVGLTPFQMGAADQPLEVWFAERLVMRDMDPRLDTLYSAFEMISSGVTTSYVRNGRPLRALGHRRVGVSRHV
jgi:cytosine/adenosine deaminase-related metal-dependent hydrolase